MRIKTRIIGLLGLVLFPLVAVAQDIAINNEAQKALASIAGTQSALSVDRFGQLMSQAPFSSVYRYAASDTAETGSTTTTINATAHTVKVGDWVTFGESAGARAGTSYVTSVSTNSFTIAPPLKVAPSNGDIFYQSRITPQQVNYEGISMVQPWYTGSTYNPIKLEDLASANGDAGVGVLGVRIDSPSVTTSTAGDYTALSMNSLGAPYVEIARNFQAQGDALGLLKAEDAAHSSTDAGVMSLAVRRNGATSATSADGDYATLNVDIDGRQYVNAYGAGVGEWFQSCSATITGTADTAIKAAVASNRMYVTDIGCNNTATVASTLVFKDGATTVWQGNIGNSTLNGVAGYSYSFKTPLRGSVNTAFNVALGTTATNTVCCITGYISAN